MKSKTIQKEIKSPVVVPVTHDLILKQFFNYKKTYITDKTIKNYKRSIEVFFKVVKKDIQLTNLEDISIFVEYLKNEKYSVATISNYLSAVKTLCKYTKEMGYNNIPYNLIKSQRYEETKKSVLGEMDFDMIDCYLDKNSFSFIQKRLLFKILWETGARLSEVTNLKFEDLNDDLSGAYIVRQKVKVRNIIIWSDDTKEILQKYLGLIFEKNINSEYLFNFSNRTAQRWLKNITELLELDENITPHSFRHGKAHQILKMNGNQHDIKAVLGHSSITASDHYTRLNILEQKRIKGKFL